MLSDSGAKCCAPPTQGVRQGMGAHPCIPHTVVRGQQLFGHFALITLLSIKQHMDSSPSKLISDMRSNDPTVFEHLVQAKLAVAAIASGRCPYFMAGKEQGKIWMGFLAGRWRRRDHRIRSSSNFHGRCFQKGFEIAFASH